MSKKQIGFVQFHPRITEKEFNLKEIERLAHEGSYADLLVFPELSVSGYDFISREELAGLAEPLGDGPTSVLALKLAKDNNTTIVIGYPESEGVKFYNSSLMALPDGQLVNYRKVHLFSRETKLFAPGDKEPEVIETPAGRVGMMICFDWAFPEIARILALKGAQIIAHPSNLVLQYCQKSMYARSVENRVFTITANRTGTEMRVDRNLNFTGMSQVLGPDGKMLVQANMAMEMLGVVEVDPEMADNKWITMENSVIADRRIDLFNRLMEK